MKKSRHNWSILSTVSCIYMSSTLTSMDKNTVKYAAYLARMGIIKYLKKDSNVTTNVVTLWQRLEICHDILWLTQTEL